MERRDHARSGGGDVLAELGHQLGLRTLVAANVARSRADALAWCVRLVGRNTDAWLSELRDAMQAVERLRADGPTA